MNEEEDISFIQPAYAKYRKKLYEKLSSHHNVVFHYLKKSRAECNYEMPAHHKYIGYKKEEGRWKCYLKLFKHLLLLDDDIIISSISDSPQSVLSIIISKMTGASVILWVEEWRERVSGHTLRSKFLLELTSKYTVRHADAIVVPGRRAYKYCRRLGASKEKIFFVNQCSIDYSKSESIDLRKRLGIKSDMTVILYLSTIIERKGLDILIRAMKKLEQQGKEIFLLIVGDGPFRDHCESLATNLELENYKFVGFVKENNLPSYYKTADVFVLPSVIRGHYEPAPISICEAMSMNLPIVTTDAVGTVGDAVKNGVNGFVVENGNITELAGTLRELIEDSQLRMRMGEKARKIYERYSDYDFMVEGFEHAIEYALEK